MTAYRAAPDGPFVLTIAPGPGDVRATARARRPTLSPWLAIGLSACTTIVAMALVPAAREHPFLSSCAVSLELWLAYTALRSARRVDANVRARTDATTVTLDENGIRISAVDGAWRSWAWSHVADVRRSDGTLAIRSADDQVLVVPTDAHPEIDRIARFVAARATGRVASASRALTWVTIAHAALVTAAIVIPAPRPVTHGIDGHRSTAPRTAIAIVRAAIAADREPTPDELAAVPLDPCSQHDLRVALLHAGLDRLVAPTYGLEAAQLALAGRNGLCRAADVVVLGRIVVDDAVLGRCEYFALSTVGASPDAYWLFGPQVASAETASRTLAPLEWIEENATAEGLIRHAAAQHWLVLGRGPVGVPEALDVVGAVE